MEYFKWIKEKEIVAEDGTMKIVEFKRMYLTDKIRLSRRLDMEKGCFSIEKQNKGVWEIEVDWITLNELD